MSRPSSGKFTCVSIFLLPPQNCFDDFLKRLRETMRIRGILKSSKVFVALTCSLHLLQYHMLSSSSCSDYLNSRRQLSRVISELSVISWSTFGKCFTLMSSYNKPQGSSWWFQMRLIWKSSLLWYCPLLNMLSLSSIDSNFRMSLTTHFSLKGTGQS